MLPKDFLNPTILILLTIIMVGGIILIFHGDLKILRILKLGLVDLLLLVLKTRDMVLLLPIKLHLGALI